MSRQYFPFYFSLYETGQTMTPKNRAAFYEAIISYAVAGIQPQLPKSIAGYWPIVKPMLDAAKKHYEAGEKGGRPSKMRTFGFDDSETNVFEETKTNKIKRIRRIRRTKKEKKSHRPPPHLLCKQMQSLPVSSSTIKQK